MLTQIFKIKKCDINARFFSKNIFNWKRNSAFSFLFWNYEANYKKLKIFKWKRISNFFALNNKNWFKYILKNYGLRKKLDYKGSIFFIKKNNDNLFIYLLLEKGKKNIRILIKYCLS